MDCPQSGWICSAIQISIYTNKTWSPAFDLIRYACGAICKEIIAWDWAISNLSSGPSISRLHHFPWHEPFNGFSHLLVSGNMMYIHQSINSYLWDRRRMERLSHTNMVLFGEIKSASLLLLCRCMVFGSSHINIQTPEPLSLVFPHHCLLFEMLSILCHFICQGCWMRLLYKILSNCIGIKSSEPM